MKLNVQGGDAGIEVSDAVFAAEFNQTLVHQVVNAYLAGGRAGTKAQKTRSDVRGGGRKPWRQKGTGRARAGTIRSPIWRGGGVTFAARPRDFSQKVNRKMYRSAVASILSELNRQERLVVVSELTLAEPKTKLLLGLLDQFGTRDVLLVSHAPDQNVALAARNLKYVELRGVESLDPVSLVGREKLVITADALKRLEERFA